MLTSSITRTSCETTEILCTRANSTGQPAPDTDSVRIASNMVVTTLNDLASAGQHKQRLGEPPLPGRCGELPQPSRPGGPP
jgi:hypothetical protein